MENYLASDRASYISTYALEEGYDTAKKSRGRDAALLREANHAIVSNLLFRVIGLGGVRGGSWLCRSCVVILFSLFWVCLWFV